MLRKEIFLSILMLLSGQISGICGSQGVMVQDQDLVQNSFELGRVHAPTLLEVALQKKLQSNRTVRRYAVTVGVSLSVFSVLYLASSIRYNLEEQKKLELIPFLPRGPEVTVQSPLNGQESSGIMWPVWAIIGGVKSLGVSAAGFGKDFAKFLADSATILAAGVVTSAVCEHLRNKMSQAYQEETLLWFVDQQTKIRVILTDLKQRTAEYDLYGALLSQEMLSQDTQIHLKAFINEISSAAADYKNDSLMRDYDYFAYLLGEVKKKYIQKADHLEQIQSQLVPLIAHRHRAIAKLEGASLFDRDMQSRVDIADLSRQLVFEMGKLLAFIEIHKHKHQARVKDLIVSFNRFIEYVETMLKSSPEQVAIMSKENRGVFTVTYEYERMFDQQINFLDKYCKMVIA